MLLNMCHHFFIFLGLLSVSKVILVHAEKCNFTSDKKISAEGINCRDELNERNGFSKELRLNFDSKLIFDKAPVITTTARLLSNADGSVTAHSFLDVIALTPAGPLLWSFTKDQNDTELAHYLYIPEQGDTKNVSNDIPIKLLLSTSTNKSVQFSVSLEFRSFVVNKSKDFNLTYGSPIVYKYLNKGNVDKRIRVHVTSSDIEHLRSQTRRYKGCSACLSRCSCSIVAIQDLNTPFHQDEDDVVFKSAWQTMIGRAVLDVSVGPSQAVYKDGFYVVILKKRDDRDCKLNDLDLTIDGKAEEKSTKQKIKEFFQDRGSMCNDTEHLIQQQPKNKQLKQMNIEITEIDNDIEETSGTVLGIYLGVGFLAFILSGYTWPRVVFITGKVRIPKDHKPFSLLQWLGFVTKAKKADQPQGVTNNELPDDADDLETTSTRNEQGNQNPAKTRSTKCFFIETWDDNDEEHLLEEETKTGAIDGIENTEEKYIIATSQQQAIKSALGVESTKSIRVVDKTIKTELCRIRRNPQEAKLTNFATMCDPSMFPKALHMKSDMYYWIMILSGIFYVLPAMQLMLAAQRISGQTGSQDVCFYNFLCRRTSSHFEDYGHVFSNISYLFCGVYFIIHVFIRACRRKNAMIKMYYESKYPNEKDEVDEKKLKILKKNLAGKNVEFLNRCGIPEQYGIFYALGIALILEGVLSGCYHVCPVNESFQFDTTFMYMITVMIFLKIYQFRHPDITANAYVMFLFIAIMLILEAIGYYSPPGAFLVIFIFTYLILTFGLIIDLFFQKNFRREMKDSYLYKRLKKRFCPNSETVIEKGGENGLDPGKNLKNEITARKIFFLVMALVNLCIAIFCFYRMSRAKDSIVSNYLLMMFGVNMFGYAVNYTVMKCYYVCLLGEPKGNRESITFTCWVYIILTLIFCGAGLVFFKGFQEKTTLISPSESRHLNAECTLFFFDKHDIWHFASGFGLLFLFMTLLTLEDNNTSTPWEEIPVF